MYELSMSFKGIDMTKKWFSAPFCLFLALCAMPAQALVVDEDRSLLCCKFETENIKIDTVDNLSLAARLYQPKLQVYPGKRPAIIFTNSWTFNEFEYEIPARYFADRGYIVL